MRFLGLATLTCLLEVGAVAHGAAPPPVPVGQTVGEAILQGLNGADRTLSSFRGRPLLINVWASWCGPCRQETASLERLAWRDPKRQYAVIGISTDDDRAEALKWLKRSNGTISHFLDRQLQMEHMLGAASLPLTVLIDARGKVLARIYGAREWDSPESLALIERMFGARAVGK